MEKIGVLIVDDHPVVRQGMKNFFEAEGELEVRGVAASGEEAIEAVERLHPEVVMMDLVMPGMSGVEAIRTIKESWPEIRVIVITT
jgi:NarL family two-component system response regulator LiaR